MDNSQVHTIAKRVATPTTNTERPRAITNTKEVAEEATLQIDMPTKELTGVSVVVQTRMAHRNRQVQQDREATAA
jgi:hypothetical protein